MLVVMFVIISCIAQSSFAASGSSDGNVTLTPSKTSVQKGEEFTVTVSQECSDGIIGFEANLEYDTNVFELKNVATAQNWSYLGEGTKLDAMTDNDKTSGDVFTITFLAKSDASTTTSQIKLTEIKLYKTYDDVLNLNEKATTINITADSSDDDNNNDDNNPDENAILSKIEITKAPNKTQYTEGERFSPAGMIISAIYSDETEKQISNYTYSPNGALTTQNKLITFSYQENGVTKTATQTITVTAVAGNNNQNNNDNNNDKNQNKNTNTNTNTNSQNVNKTTNTNNTTNTDATTTKSNLPATGAKTKFILIIVAGLIGIGIVSYMGYKKYKEI